MTSLIEVKNLCKTYIVNKRQNNVLKNVNMTINEGEMVAVMGPSGSENQHYFTQFQEWIKQQLEKFILMGKT